MCNCTGLINRIGLNSCEPTLKENMCFIIFIIGVQNFDSIKTTNVIYILGINISEGTSYFSKDRVCSFNLIPAVCPVFEMYTEPHSLQGKDKQCQVDPEEEFSI